MVRRLISSIFLLLFGYFSGAIAVTVKEMKENKVNQMKHMSDKHLALMLLLNQWLSIKQKGGDITNFFKNNNITSIAIYGMSYIGERLYDDLKESSVNVAYIIDKNKRIKNYKVEVLQPEDELPCVDAIIVTPVFYFNEIKKMLSDKTSAQIISMEYVLEEIDI